MIRKTNVQVIFPGVDMKDVPRFPWLYRKKQHGTDDIGIHNTRALFNLAQIKEIRLMLRAGLTQKEIGIKIGTNQRTIGKIKRGKHYAGQE